MHAFICKLPSAAIRNRMADKLAEKTSNTEVHCQLSSVTSDPRVLLLIVVGDSVQYDDGSISSMTGTTWFAVERTYIEAYQWKYKMQFPLLLRTM
jgi:hypothetical protein